MRTLVCALCLLFVGCGGEDRFFDPVAFAMTSDMPPVAEGEEISYWQVQRGYELPLRDLTLAEQERVEETYANPPEPWLRRAPWIELGDLGIEIEYTISNLTGIDADGMDDEYGYADNVRGIAVEVLVDAWTEFHEYVPGIIEADDEVTPNLSGIDDYVIVPNGGRVTGAIRTDQMEEIAYDFATILADPEQVNANCVVYFPNDHESPERCAYAYVPGTVPGLVGFTLGMRTTEAADLALEFIVRVRDAEGKLWIEGEDDPVDRWELPPREIFSPTPMGEYMM